MDNTLHNLSSGAESVAAHLDLINSLCDDLLSTFCPSREQVSTYATEFTSSLRQQDYLITDETLRKIRTLDVFLGELYDISTEEELLTDHRLVRVTIQEKIDSMMQALLHNNYFHMTYGWRVTQVIKKLETKSHSFAI